jgi:hypothetical protein
LINADLGSEPRLRCAFAPLVEIAGFSSDVSTFSSSGLRLCFRCFRVFASAAHMTSEAAVFFAQTLLPKLGSFHFDVRVSLPPSRLTLVSRPCGFNRGARFAVSAFPLQQALT